MKRIVLLLLTAMAALAAENSWVEVRELKRGAELRIYRVNTKEPFLAKFDQASDESLIVITKNGQVSIPKEDIQRLDRRRAPPHRLLKETRVERNVPRKAIRGVTTWVTTRLDIPPEPAFEKIYDRTPAAK